MHQNFYVFCIKMTVQGDLVNMTDEDKRSSSTANSGSCLDGGLILGKGLRDCKFQSQSLGKGLDNPAKSHIFF